MYVYFHSYFLVLVAQTVGISLDYCFAVDGASARYSCDQSNNFVSLGISGFPSGDCSGASASDNIEFAGRHCGHKTKSYCTPHNNAMNRRGVSAW